jgi:hypothetical protein
MVENLQAEGLKGEIAAVRGLDLDSAQLVFHDSTKVRRHEQF